MTMPVDPDLRRGPDRRRTPRGGRRDVDRERVQKAICPACGHWDSLVMQGWGHPAGYTRRRKCLKCLTPFRTREIVLITKKITRIVGGDEIE